jgi:hypothetical protein
MVTLRGTRVQVLIYNHKKELTQLIYSPSISAVAAEISANDFDKDGIKGVISSHIILSALYNVEEPIPILFPDFLNLEPIYIKASYIDDTLWEEYVKPLKDIKETKEFRRKNKEKMRIARAGKKGKRGRKNDYQIILMYKDTKETYQIYNCNTMKMVLHRSGITRRDLGYFMNDTNILKYSKVKHIQEAIEKHGLLCRVNVKPVSQE